jgi:hypothetical protein
LRRAHIARGLQGIPAVDVRVGQRGIEPHHGIEFRQRLARAPELEQAQAEGVPATDVLGREAHGAAEQGLGLRRPAFLFQAEGGQIEEERVLEAGAQRRAGRGNRLGVPPRAGVVQDGAEHRLIGLAIRIHVLHEWLEMGGGV